MTTNNRSSSEETTKKRYELGSRSSSNEDSLVDLNKLLERIGEHVTSNRLRVKEFFQDMDPLNAGLVTKSQFVRCLSTLGMSSLGKFNITKAQVAALLDAFADTADENKVNWKRFEHEVGRRSAVDLSSDELTRTNDAGLTEESRAAVANLKSMVDQRRLNCWGPFKDYDK